MDEVFHHIHHMINRSLRIANPKIPNIPEERNPVFFVYPIGMGISLIIGILWLTTNLLNRKPLIALMGNLIGGILVLIGGISAMRHAAKYINLNQVSDEELTTHPVFIHNFIVCIISILAMILYIIPTWIAFDLYKWNKGKNKLRSTSKNNTIYTKPKRHCKCSHCKKNHCPRVIPQIKEHFADSNIPTPTSGISFSSFKNLKTQEDRNNEPIILYCCCVDICRYLKVSKHADNYTHEFQVIQIM